MTAKERPVVKCARIIAFYGTVTDDEKAKIKGLPKSLGSALKALAKDNEFLKAGGVFPQELIDLWIKEKKNDLKKHITMPTPMEFEMYYDL